MSDNNITTNHQTIDNGDFPSLRMLGDKQNLVLDVAVETADIYIDNIGDFIFTRHEADGSIHLVHDPLNRWSVDQIPAELKKNMEVTYSQCLARVSLISTDRICMILNITEQVLDSVFNSELAKSFAKPPFSRLITHILDTNLTVSRQNFLFPAYTFHRVRVGSLDSDNLVEKVFFLRDFEFKLMQRLSQIKSFTERFPNCHSLKAVILKAASPSRLTDSGEIRLILDHIKSNLLNAKDARECWERCNELPMPNTEAAKFIRKLNSKRNFVQWYLNVSIKFKNKAIVVKTLTHHFGRFKDGEEPNADNVVNDIINEPGFVNDMFPIQMSFDQPTSKSDLKNKQANNRRTFHNDGKDGNGKIKKLKTDNKGYVAGGKTKGQNMTSCM
ncbi:putative Gag protein, transposable element protein [Candida dubliniensis CD36]|uniref:Gag protein, transposable element protein n=1 Tax=Candida dubliniensis (strain CD36 / ATCC MYA-646 / CBS 7987 / NCPF 3949 / NRRL Y-17841) TaxID=573826 RepID=B9W7N1_CANDC|nr:putative Gag protein, transposable element protein [Candida dubliniensis CD36]CAX44692.1 putative Gag protein, transposable element protein [Candida dubliniensis CD36]